MNTGSFNSTLIVEAVSCCFGALVIILRFGCSESFGGQLMGFTFLQTNFFFKYSKTVVRWQPIILKILPTDIPWLLYAGMEIFLRLRAVCRSTWNILPRWYCEYCPLSKHSLWQILNAKKSLRCRACTTFQWSLSASFLFVEFFAKHFLFGVLCFSDIDNVILACETAVL